LKRCQNKSDVDEVFELAKSLIEHERKTMKILYQLAFIYTSESPKKDEAWKIMKEMVKKGLITEAQMMKAIEDVTRWRKLFLDRETRRW